MAVDDPEDVQTVIATLRVVLADRARLPEMKQACRAAAVETLFLAGDVRELLGRVHRSPGARP